jgi:hypothetical protein
MPISVIIDSRKAKQTESGGNENDSKRKNQRNRPGSCPGADGVCFDGDGVLLVNGLDRLNMIKGG